MFQKFIRGRYGIDTFSLVAFLFGYVLLRFRYLWIVGYILMAYTVFRVFSKNTNKRVNEQKKIKNFFNPINKKIKLYITRFQQRKTFVYFHCQRCKNNLRLPKNKGRLQGKCPVCGLEFIMRT